METKIDKLLLKLVGDNKCVYYSNFESQHHFSYAYLNDRSIYIDYVYWSRKKSKVIYVMHANVSGGRSIGNSLAEGFFMIIETEKTDFGNKNV